MGNKTSPIMHVLSFSQCIKVFDLLDIFSPIEQRVEALCGIVGRNKKNNVQPLSMSRFHVNVKSERRLSGIKLCEIEFVQYEIKTNHVVTIERKALIITILQKNHQVKLMSPQPIFNLDQIINKLFSPLVNLMS